MEIHIKNITKRYDEINMIQEISFTAYPNEIIGILAPKESGKSLLLDIIRGAVTPDKGTISFIDNGQTLSKKEIKRYIGYMDAHNPLYDDMTVFDFLLFIARLYKMPQYLRKDRVRNLVKIYGLSSCKYKKIATLSLGYRKKIGLAQAIVHNPPILLLDEPVKGLDPVQTKEFYKLVKEQGKKQTVILTSDKMQDLEQMCNTMLVLFKGKILAKGTVESLQQQVADSRVLKLRIGGISSIEASKAIQELADVQLLRMNKDGTLNIHVTNEEEFAQRLFVLCRENDWYITHFVATERSLDDIFKQLRKN